jgi:hypothetical protein
VTALPVTVTAAKPGTVEDRTCHGTQAAWTDGRRHSGPRRCAAVAVAEAAMRTTTPVTTRSDGRRTPLAGQVPRWRRGPSSLNACSAIFLVKLRGPVRMVLIVPARGRGPRPMGMCTMHPAVSNKLRWDPCLLEKPKPTCHGGLCRKDTWVTWTTKHHTTAAETTAD